MASSFYSVFHIVHIHDMRKGSSDPGRKADPARQRLIRIKTLPGFSPHAAGLSPLPAAYFAERGTPKSPGVDPASRPARVVGTQQTSKRFHACLLLGQSGHGPRDSMPLLTQCMVRP